MRIAFVLHYSFNNCYAAYLIQIIKRVALDIIVPNYAKDVWLVAFDQNQHTVFVSSFSFLNQGFGFAVVDRHLYSIVFNIITYMLNIYT